MSGGGTRQLAADDLRVRAGQLWQVASVRLALLQRLLLLLLHLGLLRLLLLVREQHLARHGPHHGDAR